MACHLGFLSVLEEYNLLPPVCVGASAGGMAAGMLAAGLTAKQSIEAWGRVARDPWALIPGEALHAVEALFRVSPAPGLLDLYRVVVDVTRPPALHGMEGGVSGWKFDWGVMVSDLTGNTSVTVHRLNNRLGWSTDAVVATTAATPGVFKGLRQSDDHLYSDGGFFDDNPTDACRTLGAERVLLVRIGGSTAIPSVLSLGEFVQACLSIGLARLSRDQNPVPADMRIEVAAQGGLVSLAHWDADVSAGRQAAEENLAAIQDLAGAAGSVC